MQICYYNFHTHYYNYFTLKLIYIITHDSYWMYEALCEDFERPRSRGVSDIIACEA